MVRASLEHVFAYVAHVEHLPRYSAPLWMTADPGERRGSAHLVTLRGYFIGLPVECVARVTLRSPTSLELAQVHGTMRAFSGRVVLRGSEDGTEMLYRVEADPGIPMLTDDASRQFLVQHVERMLDRIKLAAERKAPSRQPRAAAPRPVATAEAAAESAGAESAEAEEETGEEVEIVSTAPLVKPDASTPPEMPPPQERPHDGRPPSAGQAQEARGQAPRSEGAPSGRRRRRRRRRRHGFPDRGSSGGPGGPGPSPSSPSGSPPS